MRIIDRTGATLVGLVLVGLGLTACNAPTTGQTGTSGPASVDIGSVTCSESGGKITGKVTVTNSGTKINKKITLVVNGSALRGTKGSLPGASDGKSGLVTFSGVPIKPEGDNDLELKVGDITADSKRVVYWDVDGTGPEKKACLVGGRN